MTNKALLIHYCIFMYSYIFQLFNYNMKAKNNLKSSCFYKSNGLITFLQNYFYLQFTKGKKPYFIFVDRENKIILRFDLKTVLIKIKLIHRIT